jgi:ribosomal-protein-alanine N-acetyltransferase
MIEPADEGAAALLADLHARAGDRPWSTAEFARLLDNPAAFALLDTTPEPRGFALAWTAAGDAELLTLAVVPEARRRGAGAELLRAILAAAALRGAKTLHLEVAADNAPALGLYRKLGFEPAGARRSYYPREHGVHADAIVMSRTLAER